MRMFIVHLSPFLLFEEEREKKTECNYDHLFFAHVKNNTERRDIIVQIKREQLYYFISLSK